MSFASLRASALLICSAGAACAQAISFLPPANAFTTQGVPTNGCYIAQSCFAAADFNADGKIDVAFAGWVDGAPLAGVLLGNGDGTFRPAMTLQPGTPSTRTNAIFAGDFNGDRKPDLFMSLDSGVLIYPGNGDGTFGAPITIGGCAPAAIADFNGDGKADLVCGVTIFLSSGDGTFTPGVAISAVPGAAVNATADFNNDHRPDVLLNLQSGQYAIALGKGDGTFDAAVPVSQTFGSIVIGDFNSDGNQDLAGTDSTGALLVSIFGNGDGTFRAGTQTNIGAQDAFGSPTPPTSVGDFNKDGKLDIVAGNAIYAGNGDGTFRFPVFIVPAFVGCELTCGSNTSFSADLNGDGLADLVTLVATTPSPNVSSLVISSLLNDSPGDGFLSTGVSAATAKYPVAGQSIVSAYGIKLAPTMESASTQPLPTTLGGIRLHVLAQDTDVLAPLIYVSPTQINFVSPSSFPWNEISIETVGQPYVPKGMAYTATPQAPGLFSIGNLAAAGAVSVAANGVQTPVTVTSCGAYSCSSVPINVSGAPVYLSLYGTGFTGADSCTVGSQKLPVAWAGRQGQYAGLDQINVLLPPSLAGSGTVPAQCGSQGSFTNTVEISIQ